MADAWTASSDAETPAAGLTYNVRIGSSPGGEQIAPPMAAGDSGFRRIVQGEGVERKFPVNSPRIAKIEVKRSGVVKRAKLYYLRDRSGKSARIKEKLTGARPA